MAETSNLVANGSMTLLDFERPIQKLESQINELVELQARKAVDYSDEIRQLRANHISLIKKSFSRLSAWETVQVARHPNRPQLKDYLDLMVKDFCELHGDRQFGDDRAITAGFGRIDGRKCVIVGHNKGRSTKEKIACNFGCAHPDGYRKALRVMRLAEKYRLPVVSLIDTPGAYPGIGAEERGQAQAIATNLLEMSRLRTPIICAVIGEGGSGGALGIGVGDRMLIMQYAYYSVISPEGCAAILWKSGEQAEEAAEALRCTSKDLKRMGLVDKVVEEPLGGAHRQPAEAAANLQRAISEQLRETKRQSIARLLDRRYEKLRAVGEVGTATRVGAKDVAAVLKSARNRRTQTKDAKPKPVKV